MRISLRGYFLTGAAIYVDSAVLASVLRPVLVPFGRSGWDMLFRAQAVVFLLTFAVAPAVLALHRSPKRAFGLAGAAAAAAFLGDLALLPLKLFAIPGLFATDLPTSELVRSYPIEAMVIGVIGGLCAAAAITVTRGAAWVANRAIAVQW